MAYDVNVNRSIDSIPLGVEVRGAFYDEFIFRIRVGNGYYGARLGYRYQDKYVYFVNNGIYNTESASDRALFREAVYAWQLKTEEEKKEWRDLSFLYDNIPGYNLFIRYYIKSHIGSKYGLCKYGLVKYG
jgi:hypothetical protein